MIQVLPRHVVRADVWNAFVDQHVQGWWWHRTEWLNYCLYFEGAIDLSFMIWENRETPVALCPLIVMPDGRAEGGRAPLGAPLVTSLSWTDEVNTVLLSRLRQQKATSAWYRTNLMRAPQSDVLVDEYGWEVKDHYTRVVALTPSIAELRAKVRGSYKPLINKQHRDYIVQLNLGGADFWINDMRELHTLEAGRETRPAATWSCMGSWLTTKNAAAILLRDKITHTCLGFVYAILYKQQAYYACGAGSLGNHALQWDMIEHLKTRGIKLYELGWQGVASDKKGENIEFFKRGFGGWDAKLSFVTQNFIYE